MNLINAIIAPTYLTKRKGRPYVTNKSFQPLITQWSPLTLQGAGLFHIAMGAVLGIAAFGRTQEKLAGAAVNPTAPGVPLPTPASSMSFGSAPSGTKIEPSFAPAPAAVTTGFGGKKAPPEPDYPEL